jgi:hypothetical protein
MSTGRLFVFKFYEDHREFIQEAEMNNYLINDERLVKALDYIPYSKDTQPIMIEGEELSAYSYIKLSFFQAGSLLNLLVKAFEKGITLPKELVRTYFRRLVEAVYLLH